jgi:hypothetical protein
MAFWSNIFNCKILSEILKRDVQEVAIVNGTVPVLCV